MGTTSILFDQDGGLDIESAQATVTFEIVDSGNNSVGSILGEAVYRTDESFTPPKTTIVSGYKIHAHLVTYDGYDDEYEFDAYSTPLIGNTLDNASWALGWSQSGSDGSIYLDVTGISFSTTGVASLPYPRINIA